MRLMVSVVVACLAGCAGTPSTSPASFNATSQVADADAGADAASSPKIIPERIKGAYKVIEHDGVRKYCTRELATGSRVNYRTICLSQAEYDKLETESRDFRASFDHRPDEMKAGP